MGCEPQNRNLAVGVGQLMMTGVVEERMMMDLVLWLLIELIVASSRERSQTWLVAFGPLLLSIDVFDTSEYKNGRK